MEWWGMLVFVSFPLFGTAVDSFGVKQLDKVAWRCFAATKHFHRELKTGVCHHRVSCELVQLLQCTWCWGKGMPDATGMDW